MSERNEPGCYRMEVVYDWVQRAVTLPLQKEIPIQSAPLSEQIHSRFHVTTPEPFAEIDTTPTFLEKNQIRFETEVTCREVPQASPQQIVLPVHGSEVPLEKRFFYKEGTLTVTWEHDGDCQTADIPFRLLEKFYLYAPEGTMVSCSAEVVAADVFVRKESGRYIVMAELIICQEVMVTALSVVQLKGVFCYPRADVEYVEPCPDPPFAP
ncbi:hypothetical protein [Alteribacter natronophilus]|uniref:hypothetical protein n=1 Tax=Alteribacter natronophilus TaxID=2583810 RepID=UPI00110E3EF6|nr:hypothetical protein [Alteribacter natronophilus]TMW71144.1 hypothetical protein FGB90_14365 [Alteribacter natronophilus]